MGWKGGFGNCAPRVTATGQCTGHRDYNQPSRCSRALERISPVHRRVRTQAGSERCQDHGCGSGTAALGVVRCSRRPSAAGDTSVVYPRSIAKYCFPNVFSFRVTAHGSYRVTDLAGPVTATSPCFPGLARVGPRGALNPAFQNTVFTEAIIERRSCPPSLGWFAVERA